MMDAARTRPSDAPGGTRPDLCPAHFRAEGGTGEAGPLAPQLEAGHGSSTGQRPAPALVVLVRAYTEDMRQLPAELLQDDVTTAEKLVYMWVRENPGEHSARSLRAALGVVIETALGDLVRRGALIEEVPPSGRRAGTYRAAPQPRGPRPRTSQEETE
jgi:hypothetical protein